MIYLVKFLLGGLVGAMSYFALHALGAPDSVSIIIAPLILGLIIGLL